MLLVTHQLFPRIAWKPIKCYRFNNQEHSTLFPILSNRCGDDLYSIQKGYTWSCLDENIAHKYGIRNSFTIPKFSLYFISTNSLFICYKLWTK